MNKTFRTSRLACGTFVIVATLFVNGCASPTLKQPMDYSDLSRFQIDCGRKAEQIRFLESQRPSRDDRLWAWATNYVRGWDQYTQPEQYRERQAVSGNHTNWIINQQLLRLHRDCP
jgi:hypothetical protein